MRSAPSTVGAGAGPTPLHIAGRVYLAGPYKGAPLSVVVITPAVAGPFDLGTVVVRAAALPRPRHRPGARASPIPCPRSSQGIPLDVRSVAVRVDRARFTLNPTSCEPKTLRRHRHLAPGPGRRRSAARFQVGGCKALPYKPKLSARLFGPIHRGGHPRLQAPSSAPSPAKPTSPRASLRPAALGVHRPGPLPHDLHPRAVRRQPVPGGLGLRPRQGDHAAARLSPRRPGLPALLLPQAARRGRRPARPRLPADRGRPRRPRGLRQRRPPHHLRNGPRRARSPRRSSPCRAARRASFRTRPTSARAPTAPR